MKKTPLIIALVVIIVIAIVLLKGHRHHADDAAVTQTAQQEITLPAGAANFVDGDYAVDPGSLISWTGSKKLITDWIDTGTLAIKSGDILISGGKPVSGTIEFDMKSIAVGDTGKGDDDKSTDGLAGHLMSSDWFDADQFPTAQFVLTRITPSADVATSHKYAVTGHLMIKGIKQEVTFDTLIYNLDGKLTIAGTTNLDRTLWDIRYNSDKFDKDLGDKAVNDAFTVSFTVTASQK